MSSSDEGSEEDNGCYDNGKEDEHIFELSTEGGLWEVGEDAREGRGEGLSPSPRGRVFFQEKETEEADYSLGLPGTTPPMHGRYMKMAKKGHKHKISTKKLSSGVVQRPRSGGKERPQLKRRPQSMVTISPQRSVEQGGPEQGHSQLRRHTVHEVKEKGHHRTRRKGSGGSSGSGYLSPQGEEGTKTAKRKRKQDAKNRKKDRDEKVQLQHERLRSVSSLPLVKDIPGTAPIDMPDFSGIPANGGEPPATILAVPDEESFLTSSLQPHLLRSLSGSSYSRTKVRRAQSDAHLMFASLGSSEERQNIYCPPERKQFYRNFLKALKYSGITARTRLDTSPPGIPHIARLRSENLALENPYGPVWEQIWLEIQANLRDHTPAAHREWLFYQSERVDQVLTRITNFELKDSNVAQKNLNQMFFAASDRDSYEPIGTPAPTSSLPPSFQSKDDDATVVPENESTCAHQDSVESKSGSESGSATCQCSQEQFLSHLQITALSSVNELLAQLDRVETFYPNHRRMGDEHPKYRTILFKRRVETLTFWAKVTVGLASKLCSLSSWLGTPVTKPDVCYEVDRRRAHSSGVGKSALPPDGSILVGSPKSPKSPKFKAHFSVGSPGSAEQDDLQQSLSSRSLRRLQSSHSVSWTRSSTNSSATLQRLFSNYQAALEENCGPYRPFVDRGLKKKGLTRLMNALRVFIEPVLKLAQFALSPPSEQDQSDDASNGTEEERRPLLAFLAPALTGQYHQRVPVSYFDRSTSVGSQNWVSEFESMNLPLFSSQYIQLVHVPLDVMQECLRLQLELKPPQQPSLHSVKQLVRECREALQQAIAIRKFYRDKIEVVAQGDPVKLEQVDGDMATFEDDLKSVLEVYFDYLQRWAQVSSGHILEEEWQHVKEICTHIHGGEAEAGRRFCDMAARLIESTGDILDGRMDVCYHILHTSGENPDKRRTAIGESCRSFKELFVEIRERASKALGFAKMLRKDLEIAAEFSIQVPPSELLSVLQSSDHVQVVLANQHGKMMFVPESTAESTEEIHQLLNVSFAHSSGESHYDLKDSYLLLVNLDVTESQAAWNGCTVPIKASAETTIAISEIQVESLKMIVSSSAHLSTCRNSFLSSVGKAVKLTNEQTSSHENVNDRIGDLKMVACDLAKHLMRTAMQVTDHLSMEDTTSTEDLSKPYQSTMHACFNLGFEYVREVFRLLGDDMGYQELGKELMEYAHLWMRFVLEKCHRGRGTRPRWATTGLDFLTVVCAPRMLATISQTNFEVMKKLINRCLDHLVGEAPPVPRSIKHEVHPTPTRINTHGPWRKTPKPPFGFKSFSFQGTTCTRVEEECSPLEGWGHGLRRKGVEEGGWRVEEPVAEGPIKIVPDVESSTLHTSPHHHTVETVTDHHAPNQDPLIAMYGLGPSLLPLHETSPPVSNGSCDSVDASSGHDSPHVLSGEITSTVGYSTPIPSKGNSLRTPGSIPSVERVDSNVSTTSAHYSPYLRTPSSGSFTSSSTDSLDPAMSERTQQIQIKIRLMEKTRDDKLYREKVIGHVTESQHSSLHEFAKLGNLKQAHFKWQRGRKLGEGRFGKVYECLNLDTGEINAVKQLSIQEKDTSAIETIVHEISLFQKLSHPNIVKFYGVEVHHSELYMFMEYCNEGTLWSIAQQGLTEPMIRHYTRDLLKAVFALHDRGIVHRDIKGANIFLSSNGSIKLGDFGLSVQLKNFHKTMPNEIKQQVGTVPYMPPEVILKQEMGRPMDIWSVGCVVVEMATGKLPWSEYDNQFQIMYQLGIGKSPTIPEGSLGSEGHHFLSCCFEQDPSRRWKVNKLLDHAFVKVSDGDSSPDEA